MNKIKQPKESFISIIIPLYVIVERFHKDIEKFKKIKYHLGSKLKARFDFYKVI